MPSQRTFETVALSTAATGLTAGIALNGKTLCGIIIASTAWTNANLTFQGAIQGSTFFDIYGSTGNEITYVTSASRCVVVDPSLWVGLSHIKVRSGTTGSAVAQQAAREFHLLLQALGETK